MKFSTTDFFCKCDQIRSFLRIWSHLLKKSLMENFNFCEVKSVTYAPFALSMVMSLDIKISLSQTHGGFSSLLPPSPLYLHHWEDLE